MRPDRVAAMPEAPRRSRSRGAIVSARAERPGPLTMTTRQIAAARRRDAEDRADRTRLEVLVDRLDGVIEACERAHLDDLVDAPAGLAARARAAIAAATAVLTSAGEEDLAADVALNVTSWTGAGARIADVMDVVWEVQDGVFDLLFPGRRGLPCEIPDEWSVVSSPAPSRPPVLPRRPVASDRVTSEAAAFDVATTWAELIRSAQQIWAWPVGSPERERLCDAFTRAVKQRMPRRRDGVAMPRTAPATPEVLPPAVSRGCAHCGRPCESEAADGVRYCSTEHLLLARITGVGRCSQSWR